MLKQATQRRVNPVSPERSDPLSDPLTDPLTDPLDAAPPPAGGAVVQRKVAADGAEAATKAPEFDPKSLGGDAWPVLLDAGTSESDISESTAGKYHFKTGRLYGFEMSLQGLHYGTSGGFGPPLKLDDLGPEKRDVFDGGGASVYGSGTGSFLLEGDRDAKGMVVASSKFPVKAANNGLLNVLRLGSSLRLSHAAAAANQAAKQSSLAGVKLNSANKAMPAGPNGRRNVIAARLTTGQDVGKADSRQEDSFQKGSGDHYAKTVFGPSAMPRFVGALLKEGGAPDAAIKNRISSVMGGYNVGLPGILKALTTDLVRSPDWFYLPQTADLSPALAGVSPKYKTEAANHTSALSETEASINTAYRALHANLKTVIKKQLTVPSVSTSNQSAGDASFEAVKKVLVASVEKEIDGFDAPYAFDTTISILNDDKKEMNPSASPAKKGDVKIQEVNDEGLVGGARKR